MAAKRSRSRDGRRFVVNVHKPHGVIQPRVQKVGPEHFGIVDCAKARFKWMFCDFYGKGSPQGFPRPSAGRFQPLRQELARTLQGRKPGRSSVSVLGCRRARLCPPFLPWKRKPPAHGDKKLKKLWRAVLPGGLRQAIERRQA
jgi:hypothetical protein